MNIILDLLAAEPEGLTQAVICTRTGLPKATVSRLVNSLTEMAYLEQIGLSVRLGVKLLVLGTIAGNRMELTTVARPFIDELSTDIGEMVKLSIMRSNVVYPLISRESPSAIRITLDAGLVFPPHIGAAGKLLLALSEEGRRYRDEVLENIGLEAHTEFSLTDKNELERSLEQIRESRTAVDNQEETLGIYAVAAPVLDYRGRVIAALSIPFFGDIQRKQAMYMKRVQQCARAISQALGYREEKQVPGAKNAYDGRRQA